MYVEFFLCLCFFQAVTNKRKNKRIAFSQSASLGFSTSMAIMFHEVPHELGDYGILIAAGFTHIVVLMLNTLTSLLSLTAFLVIAGMPPHVAVREYIFAVTSGVFIYIGLAGILPRMKNSFKKHSMTGHRDRPKILLIIAFFFIGWLMMLMLALFEDNLKFNISFD
jgi:zinc transporter ZupT